MSSLSMLRIDGAVCFRFARNLLSFQRQGNQRGYLHSDLGDQALDEYANTGDEINGLGDARHTPQDKNRGCGDLVGRVWVGVK